MSRIQRILISAFIASAVIQSHSVRLSGAVAGGDKVYKIGVLAERGEKACLAAWQSTARYLSDNIPGADFVIVPLGYDRIGRAIENKAVDFMVANPAIYVEAEIYYGAQRIATLEIRGDHGAVQALLGGVLFFRSDRKDIRQPRDLLGKRVMAVDGDAFGGWITVWREFKEQSMDPRRYFSQLIFGAGGDAVVQAVQDGQVEAGIIKSGFLEQLAQEGKIDIQQFKVLSLYPGKTQDDYPFRHSTRLYPNWPFAKLENPSEEIAEAVMAVLLRIKSDDLAAINAGYSGWTVPANYTPIHECLRVVKWGPYKDFGRITPGSLVAQYWPWLAVIGLLLVLMAAVALRLYFLNINLNYSRRVAEDSRQRLEDMINFLPDATFVINPAGIVIAWNKAIEEMTGVKAAQIVGKGDYEYALPFYHVRRPILIDLVLRSDIDMEKNYPFIKKGKDGLTTEILLPDVAGKSLFVWGKAVVLRDKQSKVLGAIESIRDISDIKRSQEQLESAFDQLKNTQAQLVQSAKMASIGQLAGGVAHEINNPLTGALNTVQLIKLMLAQKKEIKPEEFIEMLNTIEESSARCVKITRALLDFSRASKATFKELDLNEIVGRVTGLIGHELKLQNIILEVQLQPGLPGVIGDVQLLEQVVFDTISNARWAVNKQPDGKERKIMVSTAYEQGPQLVRLDIGDTGVGIKSENLEKIFEPFFTTKGVGEGTGLGLSIVYSIIREHKGTIEAESELGKGTRFKICLPVGGK